MHVTCWRCRAGVVCGTDGHGNLTERVVPCRCAPRKPEPPARRHGGGRVAKPRYCVDCGTQIGADRKRCRKCSAKPHRCAHPGCETLVPSTNRWCEAHLVDRHRVRAREYERRKAKGRARAG